MTLAEYVQTRMDELGLGLRQTAKLAGISHTALHFLLTGATQQPSQQLLRKLAGPLRTGPDNLYRLAGYEAHGGGLPAEAIAARLSGAEVHRIGPVTMLPVYGTISAGYPCLAEQHVEGHHLVDTDLVKGDIDNYFWLRVRGDSMVGAGIVAGGLVLVHCQEQVEDNEYAVVQVNGDEATVKRVRFGDGKVWLFAANPNYAEQQYDSRQVRVIGKVEMAVHRL